MPIIFSDGTDIKGSGNFIDRGNGSGQPNLLLENFFDIHYYSGFADRSLILPTEIVEDAVYEIIYAAQEDSPDNFDPRIIPNNTDYGNQFDMYYTAETPSFTDKTTSYFGFYFDNASGKSGQNGRGRWIVTTQRKRKTCIFSGGSTESVCFGTGRWNNTSTRWQTIGRIDGMPSEGCDIKVWIKRLA